MIFPLMGFLLLTPMSDAEPTAPSTREEVKKTLEASKESKPRLPFPPSKDDSILSRVNNGWFRNYYLPPEVKDGGFSREPDPAMTLDNTWKVKLFWITSRANDCRYCLGHQEHKLASAGVEDDAIGELDSDWSTVTEKDRLAFRITRQMAIEPQTITVADILDLKKQFGEMPALEIIVTNAGYNATNRWTGTLNIPAEKSGAFFKKENVKANLDRFDTPTSDKYAKLKSSVAPLEVTARPALESRSVVEAKWKEERKALFPLVDTKLVETAWPNLPTNKWVRLLANFPKAMKGRTYGIQQTIEKGKVTSRLKAEIAWVTARHDRAYYALHLAKERLKTLGVTEEEIFQLDGDRTHLSSGEQAALKLVERMTVASYKITDNLVENVRKHYSDAEVAEIIYHGCNAAFLNRVTELAKLPLD